MSYSRYFGMRSFENIVRDGRFRVPLTGNPLPIGAPVELDPANPGLLMPATVGVAPGPNVGVVVFEHIIIRTDLLVTTSDSPYDKVPVGQYAQMIHGQGAKVWFRNIPNKVLYDGRIQPAGTLLATSVDVTTLKIGAGLSPDGAGAYELTSSVVVAAGSPAAQPWLVVEQVNPTTGLVEARFTF